MRKPQLNSYNRKLFAYYFLLFVLVFTAIALYQYRRDKYSNEQQLITVLDTYSHLTYRYLKEDTVDIQSLMNNLRFLPDSTVRITLISLKGDILYDNFVEDYQNMASHINRPEVIQALQEGVGTDIHQSSYINSEYYYLARNYGSVLIRTAMPYKLAVSNFLHTDIVSLIYLVIIFFVGGIFLLFITERLGRSINQLETFAIKAGQNQQIDLNMQFPKNALGQIGNQIVQIYKNLKSAQDELSYEREKLFKHLHTSQEGLAIFSEDRKEILANNYFIQYANIMSDNQVVWSDEVFNIKAFDPINTFLDSKLSSSFPSEFSVMRESILVRKGNRSFTLHCIIFADKTFEIAINDVTEKEQEAKMKRELTSNISHELKTPVSSIKGYIDTILNNPNLPEEKKQFFLNRSLIQSERLTELVADISLLNKIEESDLFMERDAVCIKDVAKNAVDDVHLKLEEKGIKTVCDIAEDIEIKGNRSLIYSVFRNLLDNAISYAGENIEINISCYRHDEGFYYFSFSDSGVGIPEESLNRIFERFYRVDFGRMRKKGGSGLGLSIVKNAILKHKGQISVKNRIEGGLEFLFTLAK